MILDCFIAHKGRRRIHQRYFKRCEIEFCLVFECDTALTWYGVQFQMEASFHLYSLMECLRYIDTVHCSRTSGYIIPPTDRVTFGRKLCHLPDLISDLRRLRYEVQVVLD